MKTKKQWSPTNARHFEGQSLKQLQERLLKAQQFVKDHPQFEFGWHNEYLQEIKRRIADKIGKKK